MNKMLNNDIIPIGAVISDGEAHRIKIGEQTFFTTSYKLLSMRYNPHWKASPSFSGDRLLTLFDHRTGRRIA